MENRIMTFFKYDRSYNGAMNLYREIGQRIRLKSFFNILPESELKGVIFEELRQMAGISPLDFQSIMATPVIPPSVVSPANQKVGASEGISKQSISLNPSDNNLFEVKKMSLNSIPEFRIQDEFPFLKKSDCPAELNKLVTDFITAIVCYNQSCSSLNVTESNEDTPQGSKNTVGNRFEDLSIGKELNFYKTNRQVSGNHKIIDFSQRIQILQSTTILYLYNLKKRLIDNISQNKLNLIKNPSHPKTSKRLQREKEMKNDLALVNHLLNS
ncbi:MAG: hypothetical protein ABSD71_05635 [Bacteroidales bacterium]|jgi:hypothetical protein